MAQSKKPINDVHLTKTVKGVLWVKAGTMKWAIEEIADITTQDLIQPTKNDEIDIKNMYISASLGAINKEEQRKNITRGWTPTITQERLEARNLEIVKLHWMWFTADSILTRINSLGVSMKRWKLKGTRSINKIVANYYKQQKPSVQEMEDIDYWLQQSMLSGMGKSIEQLVLYIASRNKKDPTTWKSIDPRRPFEYAGVQKNLNDMRQQVIDNRNRNLSRRNKDDFRHKKIQ